MIIAKQINQEVVDNGYYELFKQETIKDINDVEVVIPRSIGQYSVAQLEQEKANYQTAIAEVDKKLEAINKLS